VLVPIQAREFAALTISDVGDPSAWIVACVRGVLSSRDLPFNDASLLTAMLRAGTIGVAIDGLNEVAREPAVAAFVKEFPQAFVFVSSQESGHPPFEVWHLPATITEYVDKMLNLYMGDQEGKDVAQLLSNTGLIAHLRSGYDVRLVINLATTDRRLLKSIDSQIGLYKAAVDTAWPEDSRQAEHCEQLGAAAWKLVSDREPNQDRRRLIPNEDCPEDLLKALERMRPVRLIRLASPVYEFVHDQMHWYLAANWFCSRATAAVMCDLLTASKVWKEGWEAQRALWNFVAEMLDHETLEKLWRFAGDDERRAVLGKALAKRAVERVGYLLDLQKQNLF
jgi:hypothetical protein